MAEILSSTPQGVHLVGSFPHGSLQSEEEVWTTAFASLPGRLRRVPDGELGTRYYYVAWQQSVFPSAVLRSSNVGGEHDANKSDPPYAPKLEDIKPTRYDEFAIASYHKFVKCREAGIVPRGVRFQASLPSPVEAVAIHVHPAYQAQILPLYEARMLEALTRIQQEIPAQDLAIQWDVAVSFGFVEQERGSFSHPLFSPWFSDALSYVIEALKSVSSSISPDVEMGYHLCYGDMQHQHFVEPKDMGVLVEVANKLIAEVHPRHQIGWLHMPVPKSRWDSAYFVPLKDLAIPSDTELFLGVVHFEDLEGTKKRIAAAAKASPKMFGVATECGMGRTPAEQLENLLDVAREASQPY